MTSKIPSAEQLSRLLYETDPMNTPVWLIPWLSCYRQGSRCMWHCDKRFMTGLAESY